MKTKVVSISSFDLINQVCRHGSIQELFKLIKTEYIRDYCLCLASQYGRLDIVRFLVEDMTANICTFNNFPLRWSAENGHIDVVEYLISKGANKYFDVLSNDRTIRSLLMSGKKQQLPSLYKLSCIRPIEIEKTAESDLPFVPSFPMFKIQ